MNLNPLTGEETENLGPMNPSVLYLLTWNLTLKITERARRGWMDARQHLKVCIYSEDFGKQIRPVNATGNNGAHEESLHVLP